MDECTIYKLARPGQIFPIKITGQELKIGYVSNLYGNIWSLCKVKNVKERRTTLKFLKSRPFRKKYPRRFDTTNRMFFLTNLSYNGIINLSNSALDSTLEPSMFYYFRNNYI